MSALCDNMRVNTDDLSVDVGKCFAVAMYHAYIIKCVLAYVLILHN